MFIIQLVEYTSYIQQHILKDETVKNTFSTLGSVQGDRDGNPFVTPEPHKNTTERLNTPFNATITETLNVKAKNNV